MKAFRVVTPSGRRHIIVADLLTSGLPWAEAMNQLGPVATAGCGASLRTAVLTSTGETAECAVCAQLDSLSITWPGR